MSELETAVADALHNTSPTFLHRHDAQHMARAAIKAVHDHAPTRPYYIMAEPIITELQAMLDDAHERLDLRRSTDPNDKIGDAARSAEVKAIKRAINVVLNERASAARSAAMTAEPRYRHVKTGGTYTIVGQGRIQAEEPLLDMEDVTIYRSDKDGSLWARHPDEFNDGRFEAVADPRNDSNSGGARS